MSDTKKRYEEAGLQPPFHEAPVSPDLHVVNHELQPVDVAQLAAPASVKTPAPARRTATSKKRSPRSTTTKSSATAPAPTPKEG